LPTVRRQRGDGLRQNLSADVDLLYLR